MQDDCGFFRKCCWCEGKTHSYLSVGKSKMSAKFDKSLVPVMYFDQEKAWMTSEIMEKILGSLNGRLSHTNRSILLLMDNAGCHPQYLQTKFSNIRIFFFAS